MPDIQWFEGKEIEITSFTDIVGECETLEFHSKYPTRRIDLAVTRPDDDPNRLYLSINGEADVDYAQWAIQYAKGHFGG